MPPEYVEFWLVIFGAVLSLVLAVGGLVLILVVFLVRTVINEIRRLAR